MAKTIQKILNEDIAAALECYPELQLISNKETKFLKGKYIISDNNGVVQGEYEIAIVIPKMYPNEFPLLLELSKNIPREDDRHIDKNGWACVEIDQNIALKSKKGISIKEFIANYVHRYFCWQLRYEAGDKEGLEEWAHHDKGTLQFYKENLNTEDIKTIIKILRTLSESPLPQRNVLCICGSNKKYKLCHENLIKKIYELGKDRFRIDLGILQNLNNANTFI